MSAVHLRRRTCCGHMRGMDQFVQQGPVKPGLNLRKMVGARGFEPPTPRSRIVPPSDSVDAHCSALPYSGHPPGHDASTISNRDNVSIDITVTENAV